MVATVIVPLDGSDIAELAVPYARSLARIHEAETMLVSVIDVPIEFSSWIGTSRLPESNEVEQWIAEREEYLAQVKTSYGLGDVKTSVVLGNAADNILENSSGADDPVIVMASHGRTGFRRMVSGSVTVRVVRQAHCPVIVIPGHGEDSTTMVHKGLVLVPLDGSELAEQALQSAIETFDLAGSHVHLVRVIESPNITMPPSLARPVSMDYSSVVEYEETARKEAERYLDSVAGRLIERGIQASWEVRDGDPATEIGAVAVEQGTQFIAMATHGRGGFNRFAFGSVAEGVLSDIQIPLFLRGPVE